VLAAVDDLAQDEAQAAYSAAHHGFVFLLSRVGDEGVRRILRAMRAGRSFSEAFGEVAGTTPGSFRSQFRAYVLSESWRDPAVVPH